MKEIRAIARPARLARLQAALRAIPGFPGLTVLPAQGFTAPASMVKRTVKDELTDFTEKLMLCVLVEDDMVEPIRLAILEACHTGQIGDGLVWVVNIESMHRIRDQHVIK
jgi:nitrogen regulatory protein P-II 1